MIDLERLGYLLYEDSAAIMPGCPPYELTKELWTRKARRLMEALLGDEPLYVWKPRKPEYVPEHTTHYQRCLCMKLVKVWPVEITE